MDDKPMNMNFFGWIREGVKQSVIGGVSDAIEQLGTPAENGEAGPQVLAFLRNDGAPKRISSDNNMVPATATQTSGRNPRKRLGRSLKEIDGTTS